MGLVDQVEYGLEPHRLIRFMDSLDTKDTPEPHQMFLTTHSPASLRELSAHRPRQGHHEVIQAGISDDVQSTLRADPEAFLAKCIVVCESVNDVGLMRHLEQY